MKPVLISVRPEWCEKICHEIGKDENGKPIYEKDIEARKNKPSEVPFKAFIYCTKAKSKWRYSSYEGAYENSKGEVVYAQGKVIGEFICNKIYDITPHNDGYGTNQYICGWASDTYNHCLTFKQLNNYLKGKKGYGWHISDLKIYDKPKELSEFISPSKAKNCVDYCLNGICSNLGYEELCGAIRRCEYKKITRPPQSWCYVEELTE